MSRKKILLVDDSATTLMMEQMVLRGQSYHIVTAKNGREAVAMVAIEQPDLILLDVVMPEMNGSASPHTELSMPKPHKNA